MGMALLIHTSIANDSSQRGRKLVATLRNSFWMFLKDQSKGVVLPSDRDENGYYLVEIIACPTLVDGEQIDESMIIRDPEVLGG